MKTVDWQTGCLCIKISHPLTFSPAGYCEPHKVQLWAEDDKFSGTAGVQDTLEGQVPMSFSVQVLVVLNPFSCISLGGASGWLLGLFLCPCFLNQDRCE